MVRSAGVAIGLLAAGLTIPELFLVTALMNAAVAVFIYGLVPEFLMRFLAWLLVHTIYRVRQGRDSTTFRTKGACIVVCNHVSYVDAVVIAACVRRPVRFVMDHRIFRVPVLSFIFRTMRTIPIAPAKEDPAMKERAFAEAAQALAAGEIVGIFPGRQADRDRRAEPVPARRAADDRDDAGAGGAAGAVRPVGKLLQPLGATARRCAAARHLSRIALVAAPPVAPANVTPDGLQATVLALRGANDGLWASRGLDGGIDRIVRRCVPRQPRVARLGRRARRHRRLSRGEILRVAPCTSGGWPSGG